VAKRKEKENAIKGIRGGVDKGHGCGGLGISRIESRDGGSEIGEEEEDVAGNAIYDRETTISTRALMAPKT